MAIEIIDRIKKFHRELVAIRHDIHAHPELGLAEVRTAAVIAGQLRELGIPVTEGFGGLGVIATIRGREEGPRSIGLRADMDALAMDEETGAPYASRSQGVMHACGHDGHIAMLLGAARYLAQNPEFAGAVHLIFQPAEEGRGGARAMLADGLFDRFPCNAVYGMHTMPGIPVGQFAVRPGPFLASVGLWKVKFSGTGGHGGASPHLATDATVVLGHFLLAIQTIVSRNLPPLDSAVLSVGHVSAGSADSPSVMPSEIAVCGTARCFKPEVQDVFTCRIEELAKALASAHGCVAEVSVAWRTTPLVNHTEQVDIAVNAAAKVVGADAVDGNASPLTIGEDFGEMLRARPGAYLLIGNGVNEDGSQPTLHTTKFDFNDEIIPIGAAYWVSVVGEELGI